MSPEDVRMLLMRHIDQVRTLEADFARPIPCSFTEGDVKCTEVVSVRIWCQHCGIHAGFACDRHGAHITSGAVFLNRACGAHGPGRLINRLETL